MKGKKAIASKFPTARIKKIMQEDEEIGKVAQGTPIVISRALELLLRDIIVETADIARTSGSKKLQPWHVKRLVSQNRQYDFLDDLVQAVADPTGGAEAGPSGDSKPSTRGKGRSAAATNGAKTSPALKSSSAGTTPPLPPASTSSAPLADSGARAPAPSVGGVVTASGARSIPAPQPYGSGKGPSNASVILNSPTAPGPIPSLGAVTAAVRPSQPDFDDYDEDDDDDDYDA